jgi:hypothetical protein
MGRESEEIPMKPWLHLMIALAALALVVFALSACTATKPQTTVETTQLPNGITVVSYPASLRGAYVFPNALAAKLCSEPVPDVALASVEKITANLGTTIGSVPISTEAGYELANNAVELAGRTQLVMLAREAMYRACEIAINSPANDQIALDLYQGALAFLETIAEAEQTKAQAALQSALRGVRPASTLSCPAPGMK